MQRLPRRFRVACDLPLKGRGIREAAFVAQAGTEEHGEASPVEAAGEIEHVQLGRSVAAAAIERRTDAQVEHAGEAAAADHGHDGVHPVSRDRTGFQGEVGRRETQAAADAVAAHDHAAQAVRPAEQSGRFVCPALGEREADSCAGHGLSVQQDGRDSGDAETGLPAHVEKQFRCPGAVPAETPVRAGEYVRQRRRAGREAAGEILGWEFRQGPGERKRDASVQSEVAESFRPLRVRGEQRRSG